MHIRDVSDAQTKTGFVFPFIFSTPVWGSGHLSLFLNVCLPSLLAPGNLPGISVHAQNRYLIYTLPEDEAELRAAQVFRRLSEILPVEVILIRGEITEPHRTMSDCHVDSIRRADEADAGAVFLPPDCIWSDGSMASLQRIARTGKSVIHMSGIRLDRDRFVPELASHYSQDNTMLLMDPRSLVGIAMRNLHPIALTHFWNEYDGDLMPANLVWTVPNEGLLLRCFHLHPLMVKSQLRFAKFGSTIDDDLALHACPDASRDYVVTDSDELLAFEMSGLSREVGTVCPKRSIDGVAAWGEVGTNRRHRELIKNTIRLKMNDDNSAMWAVAEAESDKVVNAVAEIFNRSLIDIRVSHPKVFQSRLAAMARGKRGVGIGWWLVVLQRCMVAMRKYSDQFYRRLFFANGAPLVTHSQWLIHRATGSALRQCIASSDRHIVLVGAASSFVTDIKALHPDCTVQAFESRSHPDIALVRRNRSDEVDLLITVDTDVLDNRPLTAQQLGRRKVLLRLMDDSRVVTGNYDAINIVGGIGTRLCSFLNSAGRRSRGVVRSASPITNLIFKSFMLLLAPFNYVAVAIGGVMMNLLGLLLDNLQRAHWTIGKKGDVLPHRPSV